MRTFIHVVLIGVAVGCNWPDDLPAIDAGTDAHSDAAEGDAGTDSGTDAGIDASADGGSVTDAAPDAVDTNDAGSDAGADPDAAIACELPACQATRTEPRCQLGNCDAVLGCVVTSARELETCDDGDARTYDDRCRSGSCTGLACTCTGVNSCCDGCSPRNEGGHCNAGAGFQDDGECSAGTCEATPCECTSGPCCDGCYLRPASHVCEPHSETPGGPTHTRCFASTQCEGTILVRAVDVYCSGASPACNGARVPTMPSWSQYVACPDLETCSLNATGDTVDELCVPVNPAYGCDQM